MTRLSTGLLSAFLLFASIANAAPTGEQVVAQLQKLCAD
jgi:hypothetical protein